MFHPQLNKNKKEKLNLLSEESKQEHSRISTPRYCSPAMATEKSLIYNPQVQGIIVAVSKGGGDKYVVSNPQGAKVRSIFSQVLSATDTTLCTPNVCFQLEREIKQCCGYEEDNFAWYRRAKI